MEKTLKRAVDLLVWLCVEQHKGVEAIKFLTKKKYIKGLEDGLQIDWHEVEEMLKKILNEGE